MDISAILILIGFVLGLLLLVLYYDEVDAFVTNKVLDPIARYAREVQAFLFTLLGVVLTELWRAVVIVDWLKIGVFMVVTLLILLFIWDIRQRSDERQRRLGSEFTKTLAASVKEAVKQALKEDREETRKKKRSKE